MAEAGKGGGWRRQLLMLLELRSLLLLLAVASLAWAYVGLADEVVEGETAVIDRQILLLLRNPADPSDPLGPVWLEEIVRDITALGGYTLISLFTASAVIYLLMARHYRTALLVLGSILGAAALSSLMKYGFERPRPDLVPHGMRVFTASFPSGHATGATATYLTFGALLARLQPERRLRYLIITLAVCYAVLVGLSRLYLGVHWPSDVLAGWTLGSAWALLCWLVARWLQQRDMLGDGDGS